MKHFSKPPFKTVSNAISFQTIIQTKFRLYIFWILGDIGSILWSAAKLADPADGAVGSSVLASVGFALAIGFTFAGWATFDQLIIQFLRKSSSIFTQGGKEYFIRTVAPLEKYLPYFEVGSITIVSILVIIASTVIGSGDKVLIAINVVNSIYIFALCSACVLACSSFRTNVKAILEDESSTMGGNEGLQKLHFNIGILQLFATSFLILATPAFIVFAASPFLRHKIMWTHMVIFSNGTLPQMVVVYIFLPNAGMRSTKAGAVPKNDSTVRSGGSKVAVTVTDESLAHIEEKPSDP